MKECNNPVPAFGGTDCEGDGTETERCFEQPCYPLYNIRHTTGTAKGDAGARSGAYFFTLIGSTGETGEHDCPADRYNGSYGQCSFRDPHKIGKLKSVRIENKSNNSWTFVSMAVQINGAVSGRWSGTGKVEEHELLTVNLTDIGINTGVFPVCCKTTWEIFLQESFGLSKLFCRTK